MFYLCSHRNVPSLFCVFESSAAAVCSPVDLLVEKASAIQLSAKVAAQQIQRKYQTVPIHLNGQHKCCVFTFYFKIIKICTILFSLIL